MEFTGVELSGGTELAAPVEKVAAGSWRMLQRVRALKKPMAGGRRGGEEERQTTVLWRGGDADWRSGGTMEREARWRALSPRQRSRAQPWRAVAVLR